MSPAQLSYPEDQAIGIEGQLADQSNNDVLSRSAEDTLIPFGRVIVLGTNKDKQGRLPNQAVDITDANKILGISLHSHARESSKDALINGYKNEDTISVLHKGRVYMAAEQAITPESNIFIRFSGKKQTQTIVWDGDFVTGNNVDGSINGIAITTVAFNTDQATTIAAVAAAIKAASNDIESAAVTGAREITVISISDKEVEIGDFVVSAGASQADEVVTETVALVLESDRGKIRADADGSTAAQLSKARVLSSAVAPGDIVVLELDL